MRHMQEQQPAPSNTVQGGGEVESKNSPSAGATTLLEVEEDDVNADADAAHQVALSINGTTSSISPARDSSTPLTSSSQLQLAEKGIAVPISGAESADQDSSAEIEDFYHQDEQRDPTSSFTTSSTHIRGEDLEDFTMELQKTYEEILDGSARHTEGGDWLSDRKLYHIRKRWLRSLYTSQQCLENLRQRAMRIHYEKYHRRTRRVVIWSEQLKRLRLKLKRWALQCKQDIQKELTPWERWKLENLPARLQNSWLFSGGKPHPMIGQSGDNLNGITQEETMLASLVFEDEEELSIGVSGQAVGAHGSSSSFAQAGEARMNNGTTTSLNDEQISSPDPEDVLEQPKKKTPRPEQVAEEEENENTSSEDELEGDLEDDGGETADARSWGTQMWEDYVRNPVQHRVQQAVGEVKRWVPTWLSGDPLQAQKGDNANTRARKKRKRKLARKLQQEKLRREQASKQRIKSGDLVLLGRTSDQQTHEMQERRLKKHDEDHMYREADEQMYKQLFGHHLMEEAEEDSADESAELNDAVAMQAGGATATAAATAQNTAGRLKRKAEKLRKLVEKQVAELCKKKTV
ncbi:unnamed protein product [Amoebophrya sp. A120]|nr:unnamed protein product [Amoebophrya sp. A120]|eukprot:GSA120T00024579001.1